MKLNDLNDTDNESDIETSDVDIDAQYESEYEENENDNFDDMAAMILKFLTKLIQKMKLNKFLWNQMMN